MNGPCLRVVNDCQSILQTEKNHRLVDDDDDADDLKNVLEANYISNLKFERKMKVNLSRCFHGKCYSSFGRLREETHVRKVVGLNLGTVYWIDMLSHIFVIKIEMFV